MAKQTALFGRHVEHGAKLVDFAGWEMPLHYGSQLAEHNAVREHCGMFDVSHMTVVDITGPGCLAYLRRLVANDVGKLEAPGSALYGVLLNQSGGVIDDLIVYRRATGFRAVVNAATRAKALEWFASHNAEEVNLVEQDLAMIAVQGPEALALFQSVATVEGLDVLPVFSALEQGEMMVAHTGYTGEDGVEVLLPGEAANALWKELAAAGVQPAGLGARDTLRLEAGLNLYGQDMDETTSPLVSNLGWTVSWEPQDRDFIGREALLAEREQGLTTKLTGVVLETRGVIRSGQRVVTELGDGAVTSGIFSPTLGYSIALARLPRRAKGSCEVEVRGKLLPARIVKPPFVRHGKQLFE
jgi:aminomethyltransferase